MLLAVISLNFVGITTESTATDYCGIFTVFWKKLFFATNTVKEKYVKERKDNTKVNVY